jgi:hypothetical protein
MLENLKRGSTCDGDSIIITQFNTFIQADIFKENYCLITPIYTTMGKSLRCFWELRNSFTVRSDM